jgi:hypothetical protein
MVQVLTGSGHLATRRAWPGHRFDGACPADVRFTSRLGETVRRFTILGLARWPPHPPLAWAEAESGCGWAAYRASHGDRP